VAVAFELYPTNPEGNEMRLSASTATDCSDRIDNRHFPPSEFLTLGQFGESNPHFRFHWFGLVWFHFI
jgi:hypothetical protein